METKVMIDDITLKTYQHKQLLAKLSVLIAHYTIPTDLDGLMNQHSHLENIYKELLQKGGDKRRHNRGSREERLPNGCMLRQKLALPNKRGFHEKYVYKKNDTYICSETNNMYSTLHKANEAHYVECGKVWTNDDELKDPRHKCGKARNAVSAWGNGTNGQAFYALRAGTTDQYDVPIIDINDDEWYATHIGDIAIDLTR